MYFERRSDTIAPMKRALLFFALAALLLVLLMRCQRFHPVLRSPDAVVEVKTTGYCACGSCCGWRLNWIGLPVVRGGPDRGRIKVIGRTASGRMAFPGTVAADWSVFPEGTRVYVPGYGWGRVEDRGSAVKGRHLDLFFLRHSSARRWGVQTVPVKVWYPRDE